MNKLQEQRYGTNKLLSSNEKIKININYTDIKDKINNYYKEDITGIEIINFSRVLDDKKLQIQKYADLNAKLKHTSKWLDDWSRDTKQPVFEEIKKLVTFNKINHNKQDKLIEYMNRYIKFFNFIEKEESEFYRYDQLFNKLIQTPEEILRFIEVNIDEQSSFIDKDYKYKNKIEKDYVKEYKTISDKEFLAA